MANTLLTDKMIAEELRFQMKLANLEIGDISWERVYDITKDEDALEIACGNAHTRLLIRNDELLMSIDDFSARHIQPVVDALKTSVSHG